MIHMLQNANCSLTQSLMQNFNYQVLLVAAVFQERNHANYFDCNTEECAGAKIATLIEQGYHTCR